jgi:hypothetical protein
MHRVRAAGAAITALIAASSARGAARPDPGRYSANILVSEGHPGSVEASILGDALINGALAVRAFSATHR